ncbi:lipopolysaccharide transport periplasmic protein LptA [Mergibacter septicus]|uniref:Lipopolysaccharide export system protein LptA n=1 Tax=Mergibacter septicus TaxID=221402 RepID=A0A8E3MFE9_9PAST|nr:lipopolysaccharide transport periplasmic protein LptA [Mergibacter septicus]AWX14924.1 lipopolysaccharide transport periplasmic protein LptA [Mergibacter septicus]QDJ12365.1 lipopolysaccharide transport periplasmic protein LptA [Mergibacter septicus]QDJ14176.1 lipopolysaccharide transport periplasmic protein LptA [Mergibacter septicus]UTU48376.1 lipopolysaccharide transport periplasmic protein LptA [Mergibacter septicus]WMR95997.1 lipopolysaccharide transport periplasmic protein LptA [Mergi
MKLSHNHIFLTLALMFSTTTLFALTNDSQQPINVVSNKQTLDLEKNLVTFTDQVVITQGSMKINADKVIIIRSNKKDNNKNTDLIEAFGKPVTFQQQLDNGKLVQGKADKVHYDVAKEFLQLSGNASLQQQDSKISGNLITYDVKKQQLKAGFDGSRVKTVLLPNQLQQARNPKTAPQSTQQ